MTGASKILTVSYGTFSCTLEGFDDPFSTMKAIAEYFRDLAADDRYFGAEPPTPDAAMLHRIAEREIQRRVEAKIQENGVVLRAAEGVGQGQNATITMPAASASAMQQRPALEATPTVGVADDIDLADEGDAVPALAAGEATEAGHETVAEKLSRLRAESASLVAPQVVTLAAPLSDPSLNAQDADGGAEDLALADDPTDALLADLMADLGGGSAAPALGDAAAETQELDVQTAAPAAEAALDVDLSPVGDSADMTQAEVPAPDAMTSEEHGPDSSVDAPVMAPVMAAITDWQPEEAEAPAAETQDEADPVSGLSDDALLAALEQANPAASQDPAVAAPTALGDGLPMAFATTDADLLTDAEADAADLAALTAGMSGDLPAFPEADDNLLAESLSGPTRFADTLAADARFEADLAAALDGADLSAQARPDPAAQADSAADPIESIFADSDDVTDQDPLPPILSTAPEAFELPADAVAPVASVALGTDPDEGEPLAGARAEAADKVQRARARVIRIRAREAAAGALAAEAPAGDDAAATAPAPAEAPAPVTAQPTAAQPIVEAPILSPQDEAELEAELAALRAESSALAAPSATEAAVAPPADIPAAAAAPSVPAPSAPHRRAFAEEAADAAVTRLMAQADEVMEGPDSKRRLSAIAHLKAAVAATVADRNAGTELPSAQPSRLARYRDDLALVVRAKLGVGPATGERPAPLVLVSEQRVDRPAAAPVPAPAAAPQAAAPAPVASPPPAAAPAPAVPEAGPIRPRRIVPAAVAAPAAEEDEEDEAIDPSLVDARGFSEFADRLGARTLPELIEASAAYLAVVQKRDAFSRPQLMANVAAAMPGDLPREDGLRSFGALLRSGRLSKLRRGQFVLSQQSNYLTEGKRIAG